MTEQETPSERSQRIANQYRQKAIQSSNSRESEYYHAKADRYEDDARRHREQGR
jgi:hypothetical protein